MNNLESMIVSYVWARKSIVRFTPITYPISNSIFREGKVTKTPKRKRCSCSLAQPEMHAYTHSYKHIHNVFDSACTILTLKIERSTGGGESPSLMMVVFPTDLSDHNVTWWIHTTNRGGGSRCEHEKPAA